jgi:two-component system, NtrC family, response regulator AtoC
VGSMTTPPDAAAAPGGAEVLVLEDEPSLAKLTCRVLEGEGHHVVATARVVDALRHLRERAVDVVVVDLHLPDGSGLEVLQELAGGGIQAEAVVLTGQADLASAIEAMKLGAYDYLTKPVGIDEVGLVVQRAWEKVRLRRENESLRLRLRRREAPETEGLVTEDRAMQALLESVQRVAGSDLPVLIQGESGTGKELVARALHRQSPRTAAPFVALNCASLPDTLLESELFGHERGAFTGAVARKPGLFELADRGTLFLDEVGDVSAAMQPKLLRALETQEYRRVGGTQNIRCNVRFVSASNKDLRDLVERGSFRDDLYYRLNGVTLGIPPLRERRGDVLPLAMHFLRATGTGKPLSPRALEALRAYDWPGNVRELQMVVRRAAILARGEAIEPEDVPLVAPRKRSEEATMASGVTLAELEARYIRQVLREQGGHRGKAAEVLGISVKTLYNKLGTGQARRASPPRPGSLKDGGGLPPDDEGA